MKRIHFEKVVYEFYPFGLLNNGISDSLKTYDAQIFVAKWLSNKLFKIICFFTNINDNYQVELLNF